MRKRWKAAIAIACTLLFCAALLMCWEYRVRPVEHINVLRARATQGDPKAQFDLGSACYYGKGVLQDYAEALRWYRMAADQEEPRAEDALGYMYLKGQAVPQDYAQALQWYKRAARHGNAKGQFDLATVYNDGIGVASDHVEASRWFRKAADQNYANAQDALGYMYFAGSGLPQDYSQAFFWYRKAAEQGYAKAEFDLSSMYYKGRGTSQDYVEARRWCIKAAKQGNGDAQQGLAVLGIGSDLVTKFEYLELVPSLLFGSWIFLEFLRGRKHVDVRNAALLLLGSSLLAISGMNLYVIAHGGLRYCTYPVAFRIAKRVLIGTAVLIIVTVVLPDKKAPHAATTC